MTKRKNNSRRYSKRPKFTTKHNTNCTAKKQVHVSDEGAKAPIPEDFMDVILGSLTTGPDGPVVIINNLTIKHIVSENTFVADTMTKGE